MPDLSTTEHLAVVTVLKQYVDSLDVMVRMHPDADKPKEKRREMLGILAKLQAPDPLMVMADQGNLSAHLKVDLKKVRF